VTLSLHGLSINAQKRRAARKRHGGVVRREGTCESTRKNRAESRKPVLAREDQALPSLAPPGTRCRLVGSTGGRVVGGMAGREPHDEPQSARRGAYGSTAPRTICLDAVLKDKALTLSVRKIRRGSKMERLEAGQGSIVSCSYVFVCAMSHVFWVCFRVSEDLQSLSR
jgi:hypothetical protein